MTSKIDFYREVLADDPNSRVFFPLAKMLAEQGETEEAVDVLRASIAFHPGHQEARFLLVELCSRLGRDEEAATAFEGLSSLLSNYPSVWTLWASKATGLSRDSALALRFLALALAGREVSWLEVLEKGLGSTSAAPAPAQTRDKADAEEATPQPGDDFSLRGAGEVMALTQHLDAPGKRTPPQPECVQAASASVKTRTMAELLASHGDYASALEIYGELCRLASTSQDRAILETRMAELKALMESGSAAPKPQAAAPAKAKVKLVSMLEALANRLDARATA
ncbi:Beta-barrel assembly-enhancing protease [Fundidesulfovibrio magnetotacticus]|uniref:Beta-barrel assembly-enhancing protease n=1 Tax=Fundidesulfovibrio magnetotacticus TaxID=2730080 RepID=A0A6V8M2B0_9BACT|nr:tetratricopeptide repeat protein [Fundidesulfovibrio magnetotacticus]GFK94585.1 Beta-barrel assembly-enhancing protease [Fundidesulfovibrio magnetotacticus]